MTRIRQEYDKGKDQTVLVQGKKFSGVYFISSAVSTLFCRSLMQGRPEPGSERHAELVSASPRITRIIGVILKQVQDDVPIMVPEDLE